MTNKNSIIINYLIPFAFIITGLILSTLIKLDNLKYYIFTFMLFIVIGASIYLAEIFINEIKPSNELKKGIESLLSGEVKNSNFLNLKSILKLESMSNEMWIYAYNLEWEMGDSALVDVVYKNLEKGKKYIYIVPDTDRVRARVKILEERYKNIKNNSANIQFFFRKENSKLIQFGITIYNPSICTHGSKMKPVVVFFPHFKSIQSSIESDKFYFIMGNDTFEIQEGFLEALDKIERGVKVK